MNTNGDDATAPFFGFGNVWIQMVTTLCAFFWFWGRLDTNGVGAMRLSCFCRVFFTKGVGTTAPFLSLWMLLLQIVPTLCAFFSFGDV